MLGFPLLYFKGMRLLMFQLSSFYCKGRFDKHPLRRKVSKRASEGVAEFKSAPFDKRILTTILGFRMIYSLLRVCVIMLVRVPEL